MNSLLAGPVFRERPAGADGGCQSPAISILLFACTNQVTSNPLVVAYLVEGWIVLVASRMRSKPQPMQTF